MEEDKPKVVDLKAFIANGKGQLKDEFYIAIAEEKLKETISNYRISFAEAVAVDCAQNILTHMRLAGVNNVNEERDMKDVLMIIESIKSLILKGEEIYHPFQEIAQGVLKTPSPEQLANDQEEEI